MRDASRLSAEGLSTHRIAVNLAMFRSTLQNCLDGAQAAGVKGPIPGALSDTDVGRLLCPRTARAVSPRARRPDWVDIHRAARRKGVIQRPLWEEHRGNHPEGHCCSRICDLQSRWEGKLSPVMRQRDPAGEHILVDYAGQTIEVVDRGHRLREPQGRLPCPVPGRTRDSASCLPALSAFNHPTETKFSANGAVSEKALSRQFLPSVCRC